MTAEEGKGVVGGMCRCPLKRERFALPSLSLFEAITRHLHNSESPPAWLYWSMAGRCAKKRMTIVSLTNFLSCLSVSL